MLPPDVLDTLVLEELLHLTYIGFGDLLVPAVGLQPDLVELDVRMHDIEAILHVFWIGRHPLHRVYGDIDRAVEVLIVFRRLGAGGAAAG